MQFFHPDSLDIHLNHGSLLEAMWSWAGIKAEHRQKVGEVFSTNHPHIIYACCCFRLLIKRFFNDPKASIYAGLSASPILSTEIKMGSNQTTASSGMITENVDIA